MLKDPALTSRFVAFVAERHPESSERAAKAFASVLAKTKRSSAGPSDDLGRHA